MARKLWVVWGDIEEQYKSEQFLGYERYTMRDSLAYGVFFRERDASAYAQALASRFPNSDIHVLTQKTAFVTSTKPVTKKVWNENGELVPV